MFQEKLVKTHIKYKNIKKKNNIRIKPIRILEISDFRIFF